MGYRGFRSTGRQHSFKEGTLLSFYGELRNANLGSFFVHDNYGNMTGMKVCKYGEHFQESMDQPHQPLRRVWFPNPETFFFFLFPFAPENLVYLARRFGRPPASARSFSTLRLNLVFTAKSPPAQGQ